MAIRPEHAQARWADPFDSLGFCIQGHGSIRLMEENWMLIFSKAKRATLSVRGKDRTLFLHRLLTQDIKGTPAGQVRPACLLDRLGKIQLAGLVHIQPEEILLELRAESVEPARALLEKYRISEEVEMTSSQTVAPSNHRQPADDETDLQRILAGVPAIGKELTPEVIPNELGPHWLEQFVSFTKGCYIGQEIVARIKYRAHPPRLLTGFTLDRPAPEGTELYQGDVVVGVLTSVCESPAMGKSIALGFLKVGTPPGPLRAGSSTATPTLLPFV